jgi:hypothetical protein
MWTWSRSRRHTRRAESAKTTPKRATTGELWINNGVCSWFLILTAHNNGAQQKRRLHWNMQKSARWLMNKTATKAGPLILHCWPAHKEREREAGRSLLALFCLQTRLSPAKLPTKCIYEIICSHVHTHAHTREREPPRSGFSFAEWEREMPIKYSQPACNFPPATVGYICCCARRSWGIFNPSSPSTRARREVPRLVLPLQLILFTPNNNRRRN